MGLFNVGHAILLTDFKSKYVTLDSLFVAVVILSVLIIIMLLTYFITIKPNLNIKIEDTDLQNNNVVDRVITHITKQEEEELINDYELVAVITTAIYASLGDAVPADGLVVRSIRKINRY